MPSWDGAPPTCNKHAPCLPVSRGPGFDFFAGASGAGRADKATRVLARVRASGLRSGMSDGQRRYWATWDGGMVRMDDSQQMSEVFMNGFFGKGSLSRSKPIGGSRESLCLMFEEAYFLSVHIGCLAVRDATQKCGSERAEDVMSFQTMSPQTLRAVFTAANPRFPERSIAYLHFRSRGWIVRSGFKFGSDFLLYRAAPGTVHADYSVVVQATRPAGSDAKATAKAPAHPLLASWDNFEAVTRVAGNAAKELMLCFVTPSAEGASGTKSATPSRASVALLVMSRWTPSIAGINEIERRKIKVTERT